MKLFDKNVRTKNSRVGSFVSSATFTTTLLLSVLVVFLFNFNFNAFWAGAASDVEGEGTPGFISKWVPSSVLPTLTASLTASPNSGTSGFSSTLTATVGGTAVGTINYSFWWDCPNSTTDVATAEAACGNLPVLATGMCGANANGYKCNSVNAVSESIAHTYNVNSTAKVIVERDVASPAEDRASVTMSLPPATLVVAPSLRSVPPGGVTSYGATYDPDGSGPQPAVPVTADPGTVWSSSDSAVATSLGSGQFQGVVVGTVTVRATYSGLFDTATLDVTPVGGGSAYCDYFKGDPNRLVIPPTATSTLSWSCHNVVNCVISANYGPAPGSVSPISSAIVAPAASTIYTLGCSAVVGPGISLTTTIRVFSFIGGTLREILPH